MRGRRTMETIKKERRRNQAGKFRAQRVDKRR